MTEPSGAKMGVLRASSGSRSGTGGLLLLREWGDVADVYGVCRSGGIAPSQAAVVGCSPSTGEEGIISKSIALLPREENYLTGEKRFPCSWSILVIHY